jgi:branched-chain amino acid transport system substrate-binding protein
MKGNIHEFRGRSIAAVAVFALAAAVVSACGSDSSESASGGGSAKELVIGAPVPLSGAAGAFGKPQADGAQMVADAINAAGGIKELGGAKVRLIIKDTKSDPVVAGRLMREMAREGVSAWDGPGADSGTVVANKPLIQNLKIPAFSGANDVTITEDNVNGYIFRTSAQVSNNTDAALGFVRQQVEDGNFDVKHVGVVSVSFPPGPTLVEELKEGLKEIDPAIKITELSYDPTQVKDFAPIVSKLKAAGVDLVTGTQYPGDAVLFAQAVGRSNWAPKNGFAWAGGGTFLDSFKKNTGKATDGWVATSFTSNLDNADIFPPEAQKIAAAFEEKYKVSMEGSSAGIGATNVGLIVEAAAAAKSTDPQKIAEAARKLDFSDPKSAKYPYYMTPGGVKFDKDQNNERLVTPVIQWLPDGSFTTVGPNEIANAEYQPLSELQN